MQSEMTKSDEINKENELLVEHQQGRIEDLELEVRNLKIYVKMLKEELNALSRIQNT